MQRTKSHPTYQSQTFAILFCATEQGLVARITAEKYYRHFISTHAKAGDVGTLTITLKKPKRSLLQNSFYWAYLELISLSSGNSPDDLHAWAKGKFLTTGISEIFGDKVRKVKSTTELNRSEFAEYIARIETITDIPIPNPEPFGIALTQAEYDVIKAKERENYRQMKSPYFNKVTLNK